MSQCDIELKSKLKKFYKDKNSLENAVVDFRGQVENIFDEAAREGIDPIKMVEKSVDQNVRQIEMDAYRRMQQVEAYKKVEQFVKQFDTADKGADGLLFSRHGENYEGMGSLEQINASEKNRRIGILKKELGEDGVRILKRLKDADPELEMQIRKIEYGEYDQAAMGKLDPDAVKLHKAIKKLNMYDYKQKRLSGADVGFQQNRLHRQAHNARNMEEMGQTSWVNKALKYMDDAPILDRIKRAQDMVAEDYKVDAETRAVAKLAESPEPVKAYLEMHYEKIITKERGKSMSIDDSFVSFQFDTRKKNLESSTFFKFKNAEAEMSYNREVNGTSLFESLSQDIIRDSGTVASMKLLGPNPNLTVEKMLREFDIKNADDFKKKFRFASGRKAGVASGMIPRAAEKARKLTDMALLSTSLASTLPDFSVAAYVLSSKTGKNYFATLGSLFLENFKLLKKGKDRREYMRRFNILMDDELFDFHRIGEDGKFNTELDPFKSEIFNDSPVRRTVEGVGRKIGGGIDYAHNKIMRMTGLPGQSQIMRTASVKNFAMYLGDIANKDIDSLYKGTKNIFERNGIGAKEWDLVRSKAIKEGPDGAVILDPDAILDIGMEDMGFSNVADFDRYRYQLHDKVSGMYDFIANTSSPTPGVRSKAWVETIDPNTVAGVLTRTVAQYKSFSISVYNSLLEGGVLKADRMSQTAYLMTTGMSLAYVGLLAKEGLKGKQVENPDLSSPQDIAKFSAMLLARSGTAGLMFDFLSSDYNSPWRSLAGDVLGPSPRILESGINIAKYPLDMLMSRNEKDRKKANKYLLNNLERGMPALPFTRTLLNEKIFDILHKSLNTGAER